MLREAVRSVASQEQVILCIRMSEIHTSLHYRGLMRKLQLSA